jgi:hypothetical protein
VIVADPLDGCMGGADGAPADTLTGNFADGTMDGKIALIRRGTCFFTTKTINAQNAGAIAVVVYNDDRPGTVVMSGPDVGITIPAIFITGDDGEVLNAAVTEDPTITVDIHCDEEGTRYTALNIMGCAWGTGDGVGGTEAGVGDADSAAQCVSLVLSSQPEANGATYSNTGGTGCYAEFGMTEANTSGSWQTCLFVPGFCDWMPGDGVGGTESFVGTAADVQECTALVQAEAPDANGATYSNTGGTQCYAEFGMNGPNDSTAWQTCMFPAILNLCDFQPGDGVGGTESFVGDAASMQECAQLVIETSTEANGATYSATGGTQCYAEFGMSDTNGSASWITCFFPVEESICTYETGDGVGGLEVGVGNAPDAQACAVLVRATYPTAKGATYSNTGGTG